MSVAVGAPARHLTREHRAVARERPQAISRVLVAAPWVLLGAFLIAELIISSLELRGPFLDEGIYVAAGLRTLQGHGISDNYMSWFSGSLIWPVIAALGWKAFGLAGARAAAAICVTVGLFGTVKAAGNLFGPQVRAATALAAVTSGPVIGLAHLAVYDTLAVAAAGCSFWALTEFLRRDDRAWLCVSAIFYAMAVMAKYPVLMFIGPPLVFLTIATRGRRARMDLGVFGFIAGALLLIYFLADRSQLTAFESFRVANNPTFSVSHDQIAYSQVYLTAVPLILAGAGVVLLERRPIALALLSGVIGAPVYHMVTGSPSGDQKHVVFGLIFMLPLVGVALCLAIRRRALLAVPAVLGLAAFGLIQVVRIDEGWPDLRSSAAVLVRDVHPGERLLANASWVEAAYLYDHGRINSPYDIYDASRVEQLHDRVDVCSFQWFAEVPGGQPWPASIRRAIARCGTFRRIYSSNATVTGLGASLQFVTYRAPVQIWRNEPIPPAKRGASQ